MLRSVHAMTGLVVVAAFAACAAGSQPDDGPGGAGGPGRLPGGGSGTDASSPEEAGGEGRDASGGGDDGGGAVNGDGGTSVGDGSVSLGDAAMPSNCTIGAAGPIAFVPLETMAPGMDCGSCHLAVGKPLYVSGTVDPTYHEPDLCLGVKGLQIQIVDAQGTTHTLPTDTSGNFVDNSLTSWPSPWKVAVVSTKGQRPMVGAVTSGDCNSCHTAAGASGSPGRIIPP